MISVVIPSYNRKDCILALLADVEKQKGVEFEVIMVDDCSPDNTVEEVRAKYPNIRIFVNKKNGGPSVTRNRGIKEAHGDFIVGLDSDVTLPDEQVLKRVSEAFEKYPKVDGLAFRLLCPDGVSEDKPRWWHPRPIEQFVEDHFLTSYFSGTGYSFRKEAIVEAGMFPEIYYMHYEEVELAFRILDRGGDILYCPDIKVLHHANPVSRRSEIEVYYKPRNQIILAMSNFRPWGICKYLLPRMGYQFAKALSRGHIKRFFSAVNDGIRLGSQHAKSCKSLSQGTIRRISEIRSGLIQNEM